MMRAAACTAHTNTRWLHSYFGAVCCLPVCQAAHSHDGVRKKCSKWGVGRSRAVQLAAAVALFSVHVRPGSSLFGPRRKEMARTPEKPRKWDSKGRREEGGSAEYFGFRYAHCQNCSRFRGSGRSFLMMHACHRVVISDNIRATRSPQSVRRRMPFPSFSLSLSRTYVPRSALVLPKNGILRLFGPSHTCTCHVTPVGQWMAFDRDWPPEGHSVSGYFHPRE